MITTKKYILEEDIFNPSTYRNYKFSKIYQLVNGKLLDPYISKIIYFNSNGQIIKTERVSGSWRGYPPGHKPKIPTIDVVDYLEYNDVDKIKLITTKSVEDNNLEIEKIQYDYDNEHLIHIKKMRLKDGIHSINRSTFEYEEQNLLKVESRNEVDGDLKMFNSIIYQWNSKNQIIGKARKSILYQKNQTNLKTNENESYHYNENGQLDYKETRHKEGSELTESISRIEYTNSVSNQITEIKEYVDSKLIRCAKFSRDESSNVTSVKYQDENDNQTLIEFKAYT